MTEVSTRDLAELIGAVPLTDPHALICRKAAERLMQQERDHRELLMTLWSVVKAAGGTVSVPNDVMAEAPQGFLHTHVDPSLPGKVYRANFNG